jgi:hemolysin III
VLVKERPDPWPRTFGYHEIWHSFTIAAGVCHFLTIELLVR